MKAELMEASEVVGLVVAVLGLGGAVWAALVSRQHDREQQTRTVQLPAAEEFARAAYAALAALRYVTPPTHGTTHHRNEVLLDDRDARASAFMAAREALDDVRSRRASVRLVFHPNSLAAQLSVWVIGHLRKCLELAEGFYFGYDAATGKGTGEEWRDHDGSTMREGYLQNRTIVYDILDEFAAEVAVRMIRPSWDPRKFARSADEAEVEWAEVTRPQTDGSTSLEQGLRE